MINLQANSVLAKWFVWSCDHLPLTVAYIYEEGKGMVRKKGAHYLANGTTLCHIGWVVFWVPLIVTALLALFFALLLLFHVAPHFDLIDKHQEFVQQHPVVWYASFILPELFALVMASIAGFIILAFIGGSKVGFFQLLWQYIKALKSRVCPLVRFDASHTHEPEVDRTLIAPLS